MSRRPLHVLVAEPWLVGSHRAWALGWQRHSRHRIHVLESAIGGWRSAMVDGCAVLADATRDHVRIHGRPDVVVATDMLDLAAYLGLCRGELADVPTVVYFHENQLTQPVSPNGVGGRADRYLARTNWLSLLAADRAWFNSDWQLESMWDALPGLLTELDAASLHARLVHARAKSSVHPVGCELAALLERPRRATGSWRRGGGPPLVLWNHRWDHDKGLDRAVTSLATLAREGVEFELAVLGTDVLADPARVEDPLEPIAERVIQRGRLPTDLYRALLCESDVVIAAPRQENFGVSVIEAVAAGCIPVVPDDMAFTETIAPPELRYPPGRLTTRLREVLTGGNQRLAVALAAARQAVAAFDWSCVAPGYDDQLESLCSGCSTAVRPKECA